MEKRLKVWTRQIYPYYDRDGHLICLTWYVVTHTVSPSAVRKDGRLDSRFGWGVGIENTKSDSPLHINNYSFLFIHLFKGTYFLSVSWDTQRRQLTDINISI